MVEYLGCLLDENMSGAAMARMVLKKVKGKKQFLYKQTRHLSYPLKRMLYNTLIQPYLTLHVASDILAMLLLKFVNVTVKTKLQTTQNSCIRYCLALNDTSHIGKNEFEKMNWLPVSNRVEQCLAVTAYNFKNPLSPKYMGDIYSLQISPIIRTRTSTNSFVVRFYKTEIARKSIFYSGSKIWNDLYQDIKAFPSVKNFKHALKRRFSKS